MTLRDTPNAYGVLSRAFHWFLFALIAVQLLLALVFTQWPNSSFQSLALSTHESVGFLILVVGMLFILWRWRNPKPSLAHLPVWQRGLAHLVHGLIYVAIVAQPIFGILMNFGYGFPIPVFGLFAIPVFIPVGKAGAGAFLALHNFTGVWIILTLLAIHILAAAYHALIRRDNIARRMWRGRANY